MGENKMIKLLNILQEIVVAPNLVYQKILDYIQNGSQGDLDLREVDIKRLPKSLKVVGGNLFLTATTIESLPDNLTVGGNLFLKNTPIQSLPDNLKVGGVLILSNTPIQSLPDNLTVEGSLLLTDTPLSKKYTEEEIKAMVPGVKRVGYQKYI
jgi:hypothetical protein